MKESNCALCINTAHTLNHNVVAIGIVDAAVAVAVVVIKAGVSVAILIPETVAPIHRETIVVSITQNQRGAQGDRAHALDRARDHALVLGPGAMHTTIIVLLTALSPRTTPNPATSVTWRLSLVMAVSTTTETIILHTPGRAVRVKLDLPTIIAVLMATAFLLIALRLVNSRLPPLCRRNTPNGAIWVMTLPQPTVLATNLSD